MGLLTLLPKAGKMKLFSILTLFLLLLGCSASRQPPPQLLMEEAPYVIIGYVHGNRQLLDGKIHKPEWTSLRALRAIEVWFTPDDGVRQGWRWAIARKFRRWRRMKTGSLT